MQTLEYTIIPFQNQYADAVADLVIPIQRDEFGVGVPREQQPDLMDIAGTFQKGCGNFWLALHGGGVIGTIGIVDISNRQVALKKMFVDSRYRGKQAGVGQSLLNTVFDWCRQHGITQVFLGTTSPMLAAHRFYEKNGFVEIPKNTLPALFPIVPVDTKFYRLDLVQD